MILLWSNFHPQLASMTTTSLLACLLKETLLMLESSSLVLDGVSPLTALEASPPSSGWLKIFLLPPMLNATVSMESLDPESSALTPPVEEEHAMEILVVFNMKAEVTKAGQQWKQVGVVSFGASAGCEVGYPAGFTRVEYYLDWIMSETGMKL